MTLSVVLGTYNRLDQLKRCVESIFLETNIAVKVYITDAGSTDGTVEYLNSIASDVVIPILVGKKMGQARAYNDVFAIVDTPYVCWLSDDNVVVNNGLGRAVQILNNERKIGMIGLKTQDKQGPFVGTPYIGGISAAGILNVNQGVLPTKVLLQVGGFSEEFRDYGIDPALTAEVLFAGYKIAYTKSIALLHFRNWDEDPTSENYKWIKERHRASKALYFQRYCLENSAKKTSNMKANLSVVLKSLIFRLLPKSFIRQSFFLRTLMNILSGRYISYFDTFKTIGKDYHLVQGVNRKNFSARLRTR